MEAWQGAEEMPGLRLVPRSAGAAVTPHPFLIYRGLLLCAVLFSKDVSASGC